MRARRGTVVITPPTTVAVVVTTAPPSILRRAIRGGLLRRHTTAQVPLTQTAVIPPDPTPAATGGRGQIINYRRPLIDEDDVALILALLN